MGDRDCEEEAGAETGVDGGGAGEDEEDEAAADDAVLAIDRDDDCDCDCAAGGRAVPRRFLIVGRAAAVSVAAAAAVTAVYFGRIIGVVGCAAGEQVGLVVQVLCVSERYEAEVCPGGAERCIFLPSGSSQILVPFRSSRSLPTATDSCRTDSERTLPPTPCETSEEDSQGLGGNERHDGYKER